MTVDDLWKNLQPFLNKVDNLGNDVKVIKEGNKKIKAKISMIESEVGKLKEDNKEIKVRMKTIEEDNQEIKTNISTIQINVSSIEKTAQEIKGQIHVIKDVNMTSIIKQQEETRKKVESIIKEVGDKLSNKIDQYIQKHEVEHKKIEYEIANLEWKNKIAN